MNPNTDAAERGLQAQFDRHCLLDVLPIVSLLLAVPAMTAAALLVA